MITGCAKSCQEKTCLGNPKKKFPFSEDSVFNGFYCGNKINDSTCMKVIEWERKEPIIEEIEIEENTEVKKEKVIKAKKEKKEEPQIIKKEIKKKKEKKANIQNKLFDGESE